MRISVCVCMYVRVCMSVCMYFVRMFVRVDICISVYMYECVNIGCTLYNVYKVRCTYNT